MTSLPLLYVTISLDLGGTERQLFELVAGLDRERFSPHVWCLRGRGPLVESLVERGIPVTVSRFAARRHAGMGKTALFCSQVYELSRVMRRTGPSIVHGMLPMACAASGLAVKCAGVPILVTGRRSLGHYKKGRPFVRLIENLVNKWADAVVANSEAVRADTLAWERLDPRRMHVIYNGVRIPEGRPRARWREITGREIVGPVVCMVANFFPYKGHLDFLDAATEVVRKVPDVHFVLVGDGQLRFEIEKKIVGAGLSDRVLFLGSRSDAGDVMALSHMIVLASHQEGFPNVVLEAMARAKPVVATRVGGVPEAVDEGRTGLLVPPRDPRAMAAAIIRMLGNGPEAEEMGRRGLERVRERFTVERMVHAHEELYEELLAKKLLAVSGKL